jgi:hypothetical protein
VSRFIIVLCLLALLFVVLVPVAAAAPPTPQKWVDNAKKKVWGTNGSDGSAARGAGAAGGFGPCAGAKPVSLLVGSTSVYCLWGS